jgi:glycosyltransferase involved in cell wall biosynthesis
VDGESEQVEVRMRKIEAEGIRVIRLITVGTLIIYKNQLTVLKACKLLKEAGVAFTLVVVGDGPMYGELLSLLNRTGYISR